MAARVAGSGRCRHAMRARRASRSLPSRSPARTASSWRAFRSSSGPCSRKSMNRACHAPVLRWVDVCGPARGPAQARPSQRPAPLKLAGGVIALARRAAGGRGATPGVSAVRRARRAAPPWIAQQPEPQGSPARPARAPGDAGHRQALRTDMGARDSPPPGAGGHLLAPDTATLEKRCKIEARCRQANG